MHAPDNLPILLTHNADDSVTAECVLLPSCRTTGRTRGEAMASIARLVAAVMGAGTALAPVDYEVIHLALGATEAPRPAE